MILVVVVLLISGALGTDVCLTGLSLQGVAASFGNVLLSRLALTLEELAAWLDAHAQNDLLAAADAWADRLYVLLGDAVAAGLPAEVLFAEIHASNLTKEPSRTEGPGKAVKGVDFREPDVGRVLKTASTPDIPRASLGPEHLKWRRYR